jgi:hypothetical protein
MSNRLSVVRVCARQDNSFENSMNFCSVDDVMICLQSVSKSSKLIFLY